MRRPLLPFLLLVAFTAGAAAGIAGSRPRVTPPAPEPAAPETVSVSYPGPGGERMICVFQVTRSGTSHQSSGVPDDAWRVVLVRGESVHFYEGVPGVPGVKGD